MKAYQNHCVWGEIAPELTPKDFQRPYEMDVEALRQLSRTRRRAGVPFIIVSDARLGNVGVANSAHDERPCTAVDIRVTSSSARYAVLKAAFEEGWRRIGVYPPTTNQARVWGKNAGSIHLDASPSKPQDVCWVDF